MSDKDWILLQFIDMRIVALVIQFDQWEPDYPGHVPNLQFNDLTTVRYYYN